MSPEPDRSDAEMADQRSRRYDDNGVTPVTAEEFLAIDIVDGAKTGPIAATARSLADIEELVQNNKGFGEKVTKILIGDHEAAFILGKGGRTKTKIAKVSGATVTLTDSLVLELCGTPEARKKAELYVKLVIQQRCGIVYIDLKESDCPDMTIIDVPPSCVAFVTGKHGRVLRSIEHEWNTLMFFCRHKDDIEKFDELESCGLTTKSTAREDEDGNITYKDIVFEKLVIFGDVKGRRGAELKVISAIEQKERGRYSTLITEDYTSSNADFDTDMVMIGEQDFSYTLGKDGATRRKLAKASNCVLEYVGRVAFIAGTFEERKRCREYLDWLVKQRVGPVHVDTLGRDDVTVFEIPSALVKVVAGPRGVTLRKLEGTSNTFCFLDGEKQDKEYQKLLIFSHSGEARRDAKRYIEERIEEHLRNRTSRGWENGPSTGEYYRLNVECLSRGSGSHRAEPYNAPMRSRSPPGTWMRYNEGSSGSYNGGGFGNSPSYGGGYGHNGYGSSERHPKNSFQGDRYGGSRRRSMSPDGSYNRRHMGPPAGGRFSGRQDREPSRPERGDGNRFDRLSVKVERDGRDRVSGRPEMGPDRGGRPGPRSDNDRRGYRQNQ